MKFPFSVSGVSFYISSLFAGIAANGHSWAYGSTLWVLLFGVGFLVKEAKGEN